MSCVRQSRYSGDFLIVSILNRSVIWDRQLDGALNRVPPGFYDEVWGVLARTPQGLKVAGYLLPQQPTLSDMTQYELNFSLLVEQMLSKIVDPAYRQIIVEVQQIFWVFYVNCQIGLPKTIRLNCGYQKLPHT